MSAGATRPAERRTVWSIFRPGYAGGCDDPTAAPARHYGPDAAPPFTFRRAVQNKVWIYGFGLVFLLFAIAAIPEDDPSPAELTWRILLVLLLAVGYLATAWVADCSLRTRWLYIGGYVGVLVVSYPTWGWSLVGYGAFVAVMLAMLLPWRQSRIAVVVLGLLIAATIPFGVGRRRSTSAWSLPELAWSLLDWAAGRKHPMQQRTLQRDALWRKGRWWGASRAFPRFEQLYSSAARRAGARRNRACECNISRPRPQP